MSFTRIDANNISPSGVAAGTYTNPIITINSSGQVTDASSGQLAQGIQGLQGIIGPQGVQGLGGIQGSSGYIGSDGVQGIQGIQGSGLQGIQGIQGAGAGLAVAEYTTYTYTGNGTTTTFAATSGLTVHTVLVVVDGVTQTPTTNYTISGSNVVLASAPPSGSVVQLRVLGGLIGPQGISGSGGSSVTISSIEVTDSSYAVLDDTAVNVSGGYIKITGTGFVSGCQVVVGSAVASSVTYVSSTVVHCQVPAQTAGTYTVYLTNPNGSVAIRVNGINYSSTPTWTTTSPLPGGVKNTAISIQLAATSNSSVTYTLASGSTLPSGLTLSTSGLLSGTVTTITADTAYNFTIVATDGENQDTPQAFQITIVIGDPYYEYVTLHLPGTGTNLATNNTFLDSSTNNFTITRSGNTTQGTFSPFSQTGWSNYFDGSSFFSRAYDAAWNFGAGDFTVECWFNTTTTTAYKSLMSADGSGSAGWALLINNGGSAGDILFHEQNLPGIATTTSGYNDGKWHHVAVVRNGTSYRIYVDGAICSNNTTSATASTPGALYIGGSVVSSSRYMVGYISNARIVKGTAVYTAPFTPPATPLTSITNTQLLTCQSNRFVDNSANNFTFSITGTPSVQAFSPFNPTASWSAATYGGSGYFDGSGDWLKVNSNSSNRLLSDYTIETWAFLTAAPTSHGGFIGINDVGSSATQGLILKVNTDLSLSWSADGYNNFASTSANIVKLNSWAHIALVRSSTTNTLYVDGVSRSTNTRSPSWSAAPAISIGRSLPDLDQEYITGYLSSFRIVNGTAVYTGAFTPPTAPLTAITNTSLLLNFTNAGIYDTTSKNDLETVGNAQISTAISAKWGSGSMAFDGTVGALVSPYSVNYKLGTGDFTIEMWFYIAANSNQDAGGNRNATMIESRDVAGTADGMFVIIQGNATTTGTGISFGIRTGGTTYTYAYTGSISQTTWQHLAVVRSGTTCTTYLNGTSVASNSSFGYDIQSVSNMYIGSSPITSFTRVFNGYLQDLRITKGYARYTSNFTAPTAAFPTL